MTQDKTNRVNTAPLTNSEWAAKQAERAMKAYATVSSQDRSAERCYYCGSAFAEYCTGKCIGQENS